MGRMKGNQRRLIQICITFLLCIGLGVACQRDVPESVTATIAPPSASPLIAVDPLPDPTVPEWITAISPQGAARPEAQIRVQFREPVIPLSQLDAPAATTLLEFFEITPALPGQFRILTPQLIGFQAEASLPIATRVQVRLKAGLTDTLGNTLSKDLAWDFETPPLSVEVPELEDAATRPELELTANAALNLETTLAQVVDRETGAVQNLALEAIASPGSDTHRYRLLPELMPNSSYSLEVTPQPALGNLPGERVQTSLSTYKPLALRSLERYGQPEGWSAFGRFTNGAPRLVFNNGVTAASLANALQIDPPTLPDVPLFTYFNEGDRSVDLNPWAFEPQRSYSLTLSRDLRDIFDQTLTEPQTVRFETGSLVPELWLPEGLTIFPTGLDVSLNVSNTNLPEGYRMAMAAVEPRDLVFRNAAYPQGDGADLLPAKDTWETVSVEERPDTTQTEAIPLPSQGMTAYGVSARLYEFEDYQGETQWAESEFYGLVQHTNLGVFAQWFPEGGFVRVHHLSDGQPVANAAVEVYRSRLYGDREAGDGEVCARGQTDATGVARFQRAALQHCHPDVEVAPELLVIAREADDWAYARTESYSGAYGYGVYADWQTQPPLGALFSDRQLYQRGETAYWTGLAYGLNAGQLEADANVAYSLTLIDPNGEEQSLGDRTTDALGVFSLELPLANDLPLGLYSLRASRGDREYYATMDVAEFRPPNFQVSLELPQSVAVAGETLTATASSQYLFGAPVAETPLTYFVSRSPTDFRPAAWSRFDFGPQWDWPEEQPVVTNEVAQSQRQLNDEGQTEISLELEPNLPYALAYRLDAQVRDVSNQTVTASQTVTVLPSDRLVGLAHSFLGTATEPLAVEVIVTDPEGTAIANQGVTVALEAVTYTPINEVRAGSVVNETQVSYEPVAEVSLRSGLQPQTVTLTPPTAGSYRLVAYRDRDHDHVTHSRVWVSGSDTVTWRGRDDSYLELQLDKESYQVGDTVTVLVPSPFAQAELYFAVVRDRILSESVQTVVGSAPQVQFTVTPEMLPNAAVEVVLTRQGEPLSRADTTVENTVGNNLEGTPDREPLKQLSRMGLAPLSVDPSANRLSVTLEAAAPSLVPGAEQTLTLKLADAAGQPVAGQATVMVVNEAVLQLTGYRPPDPLAAVFADRPIATRFSSNYSDVALEAMQSELQKGWGYGGGFGDSAANTRVRRDFKPVAYYNARVRVDSSGETSLTLPLPDDLTTWRVMAVAVTPEQQFGQGETTFQTTLPLLANPLLPQFARVGDVFAVGVSLTNTAELSGDIALAASFDQPAVQFAAADGALSTAFARELEVPETTQAERTTAIATQVGQSTFSLSADQGDYADAFSLPLDVLPLVNPEQVISAGLAPITLPLQTGGDVIAETLEIQLADQIVPTLSDRLARLSRADSWSLLEPAASRLLIAAEIERLRDRYPDLAPTFAVASQAEQALQTLQQLQAPNGGFRPWASSGDYVQPFLSAYAARAIAAAERVNLPVPAELRDRLRTYLGQVANNPDDCAGCIREQRLEALLGLAALGQRRPDLVASLYSDRTQLSDFAQIKLARLMSDDPAWRNEAEQLTRDLTEVTYLTGETAVLNLPTAWQWYGSATAAQSELLQLLISQNAEPQLLHQVATGLTDLQRDGAWPSLYDNALALSALANYQRDRAVTTASVTLAGESLGSFSFPGVHSLSRTDLPQGTSDLVINSDSELPYLASYSYSLPGPQPGRLQGMRLTRTVQAANTNTPLASLGLRQPSEPISLPAGAIFDIGLEIILDHPVNHVEITDFLPAGLEAVNTSFQTSNPFYQAQTNAWELRSQTIERDRISAYADRLEAGVYRLHYLVQSVTPGTYSWPGGTTHARYNPSDFGRTASSIVRIE